MMRIYCFLLLFLLIGIDALAQDCVLDPPKGLKVVDITACSAKLQWKLSADVSKYQVRYKLASGTQWSNWIKVKLDTFYVFNNLQPGKKYDFNVQAKCTDGSESPAVSKSAKMLSCSLPDQVTVEAVGSTSLKITVTTACPFSMLQVRYTTQAGVATIESFLPASAYQVNGLIPDSTYSIEVSTCKLNMNTWTTPQNIQMPQRPNIVLVIIDDSRADFLSCCGAYPFFQTPNIDRIAEEGVNFRKAFVVTSMCAPSRAAIATGLFTLKTGVIENGTELDTSVTTLPQVMQQHGYYTALIGKNHGTFLQDGKDEFDYSLESHDENQGQINYLYNGAIKIINKPNVETLTDSAIAIIDRVDDPLFLWLAYRTPHYPNDPLDAYDGKLDDVIIPWRPDTAKFSINYPSFLYAGASEELTHGQEMDSIYRNLLEVVMGLDSCMGILYDALESSGKLDNTLLIFMSDNGFTLGSHWLNGKSLPYEPSMKIPLLIRYPEWFTAGTTISDRMALNLDIAPTIYEAAGITYNEPLDGYSLKSLYDGSVTRTEMYYMMQNTQGGPSSSPSKRAIRDMQYKYTHYSCFSDTVEEFFDMVNDTLEMNNLINNQAYNVLVELYREKFNTIKTFYGDTFPDLLKNCFIANPYVLKEVVEEAEYPVLQPMVYPTITRESVELYMPWTTATAILYNEFGQVAGRWEVSETFSRLTFASLPAGVYYLRLFNEKESVTQKLIITGD
ncbi:MAG: sulfatase-like hydrolase/transferase [Chitinophagales bacterium]|nr:sulfatase-like hydrolase/transferase [Chitinophagales bacterium]